MVVEPVHDHRTRALGDGIPLQGGVDAERERTIAVVALPDGPHVGQPQRGDRVIADLGQAATALAIATQDLRGLGEPVQAVESLADQAGALQSRSFRDQRLAECASVGPGCSAVVVRSSCRIETSAATVETIATSTISDAASAASAARARIAAAPAPGPLAR